jgi:predicted aldo/keto reductase-like oxidoreductase
MMQKRVYGRTGSQVTVLTLGGAGLGKISQEEADKAIALAMEYGVNMIDVAPSYHDAELRMNKMLQKQRNRFFLAEKTLERTKEGARKALAQSMERLGVKGFDLYQMHAVGSMEELERVMGKGGALEAFKEAKETGLIKYIGLTGHSDVRVHLKALEMYDFDGLLLPVNAASMAHPAPENDFRPVLKAARDRNVGITVIKAISRRRYDGERTFNTWYLPASTKEEIKMFVNFALSQEGVTTYSLASDVSLWPMILEAGSKFEQLDEKELKKVVEYARKEGCSPLFPGAPP